MYALQIVQEDIRGTTRHTLLFEYPLVNTWMYDTTFRPLQEPLDIRPFGRISATLPGELVAAFSYKYTLPLFISHSFLDALRLSV
jgi:hypothetical protein